MAGRWLSRQMQQRRAVAPRELAELKERLGVTE